MRLLTYNIQSLRGSPPRVIDVIRSLDADVVCLQEVPRFVLPRVRLRRFSATLGLTAVSGHPRAGAVHVLVRPGVEVLAAGVFRLPKSPGRHQRGVAHALLEVDGRRLAVASVHMSLYADERAAHLPRIVEAVESHGAPVVIAGDINDQPDGAVWQQLAERYQDAYAVAPAGGGPTYSALRPARRIDAVFADPRITVVGGGVPDLPGIATASDHRPVFAELTLP